jgi:hypothetical protein
MSQYEILITYIKGEDNSIADALSRIHPNIFPDEEDYFPDPICSTVRISLDEEFLKKIKAGYKDDPFCKKVMESKGCMPGISSSNNLWYIGSRLLIPRITDVHETIFRLAHDSMGHFGMDKSYLLLRHEYYWPNMQWDLGESYIPSCVECQRNKAPTPKPHSPLHPLPVPDNRGDSVAVDFIRLLPVDAGYDCIMTMTDRLGSMDIRLIPTKMSLSAEKFASLFFKHWYCGNGLLLEIISDRDKIFVSKFWRALTDLTGVKIKMSTAYHPESDGTSEQTNKIVIQMIRYHVERNQKDWVKSLSLIWFYMMNTINASTGFSGFQLRMGRAARVILPLVPSNLLDTVWLLEQLRGMHHRSDQNNRKGRAGSQGQPAKGKGHSGGTDKCETFT